MSKQTMSKLLTEQFSVDAKGNVVINSKDFQKVIESATKTVKANSNDTVMWIK